ncbi:hypothetical protein FHU38_002864 [Saccharomonospora amisosensis]|uniref:Uncharacterized protein n=1 Tax=Saccharomonospora amisosensis TaxID=1128677 RepID=A0A7X5ZRM6_9PSEU|nr:hypothetical protein [Saccharomonospora amisosensis]NIJ12520.1 hypothetical protein [Saccharomonospora amisosensis]
MRRHTALVVAVMVGLALAGGSTALVAASGLFGSGFEVGAGRLSPVLTSPAGADDRGPLSRDIRRSGEEPGEDHEREEAETAHAPGGDDDD